MDSMSLIWLPLNKNPPFFPIKNGLKYLYLFWGIALEVLLVNMI